MGADEAGFPGLGVAYSRICEAMAGGNGPTDHGKPDDVQMTHSDQPTALELFDRPWSFTQSHLLGIDEFERECDLRGLSLRRGQLKELDRVGVLRPVFEVRDAGGAYAMQVGVAVARQAIAEGAITTRMTAKTPGPWPSRESENQLAYSRYQLLAIPLLGRFLDAMYLPKDFDITKELPWTLDGVRLDDLAPGRQLPLVDEQLIVRLSVLEPVWLPTVRQQVLLPMLTELPPGAKPEEFAEHDEAYRQAYFTYQRTVPAAELLDWMKVPVEELASQAEGLLRSADTVDPLGRWLEVVRLAPGRWKELRRDAVVALDHRIAAELILLFLHQLATEGGADADVYGHNGSLAKQLAASRLSADDSDRDGVLTDFDLSPHPLSLVVIEGETEQLLAPRLMLALGLPDPPWPIRLHNGRGVDAKLDWVYRYISAIEVHEEIPGGFRPSRPIPHIFVVADPEGTRHSPEAREQYRTRIVDHLCRDSEESTGRPIPRDLFADRLRIDSWSGATFEFAHFTDDELAAALRLQAPGLGSRLQAELAVERNSPLPRLSALWRRLQEDHLVDRDLNKRQLAEGLWPALEARVHSANSEADLRGIPLAATLLDAFEPVRNHPWGHFSYVAAGRPSEPAPNPTVG